MGVLGEKKNPKKRYKKTFGEKAEKHLSQGLAVSSLPASLRVSMVQIEEWIDTEPHFKESIEFGLAHQEIMLTKMGMKIALKNEGNYKAWSAFCRVKLGWKMETDPDSNVSSEDMRPEINIFEDKEDGL